MVGLPLACSSVVLAQGGLRDPFPVALQLADLDGEIGFRVDGASTDLLSGSGVASAGDVNGDGVDDFIIGATGVRYSSTDPGSCYVVFGRDTTSGTPFPATIELDGFDGLNGFRLEGVTPGDYTGQRVDSAGDVNGDGIDDLIISAPRADPGGRVDAGSNFVVFGRDATSGSSFPPVVLLAELDGTAGFRVDGASEGDISGDSAASAGDINGDGIGDVIIGAFGADPDGKDRAGSSYVIYGRDTASGGSFPATINLGDLDGSDGFRLDGILPRDYSGRSVSSAGDVNGDGIDDFVIGADGVGVGSQGDVGVSYVVFGRDTSSADPFPGIVPLDDLQAIGGFELQGVRLGDRSGT
ncbi:MAG: integrin alpha, partial [Planctomycetota bacterium]